MNNWLDVCVSSSMKNKFEILENDKNLNVDDFYVNFKEKLEEVHSFPTDYLFKYVVPADENILARLHAIFENSNANVSTRDSKNGKYTSITFKVPVNDANDVIIYYRQASAIEGILTL